MALTSASVTVGATATALNNIAAQEGGTHNLYLTNGAADIFLGGPTVTTATGMKVAANATRDLQDLEPGEVVYAICATSSVVTVLRSGN